MVLTDIDFEDVEEQTLNIALQPRINTRVVGFLDLVEFGLANSLTSFLFEYFFIKDFKLL